MELQRSDCVCVWGGTPLAVREDFLEEREAESSGSRWYVLSILP